MSYYAHTHKAERIVNRDLYRLNGISFQEMLENLTILLENVDDCGSTATTANLPTNSDVLKALTQHTNCETTSVVAVENEFTKVNQMCAVLWQENDGYQWYLGYIKEVTSDGTLMVDHLTRTLKTCHSKWKYPSREDIQEVSPEQIMKCRVEGDWDLQADTRKRLFSLSNVNTIMCAAELQL